MDDFHETPNMCPDFRPLNVPLSSPSLNYKQHFSLHKISKIKYYFVAEIKERELIGKDLVNILLLLNIFVSH